MVLLNCIYIQLLFTWNDTLPDNNCNFEHLNVVIVDSFTQIRLTNFRIIRSSCTVLRLWLWFSLEQSVISQRTQPPDMSKSQHERLITASNSKPRRYWIIGNMTSLVLVAYRGRQVETGLWTLGVLQKSPLKVLLGQQRRWCCNQSCSRH